MRTDAADRFCFFITPLGAEKSAIRERADELLTILSEVVSEYRLRVVRADHIGEPGMITDQVVRTIINSEMVFADLTGANANVYYELGVAHSLGRPVVTLIDRARELAFDTAHDRAIVIGDDGRLTFSQARRVREQLEGFVSTVLSGRYRPRNVVVEAASLASVDELAGDDPVIALLTQTHEAIAEIRRLMEATEFGGGSLSPSDNALLRTFVERLLIEHPLPAGTIRNALMDGSTSAEHDEWVERLCDPATA